MAGLRVLPGGAGQPPSEGDFEVRYVAEDGTLCRVSLAAAWRIAFEDATPARRFVSYKGQRNYLGRWWAATVGGHVGFESWLERDHRPRAPQPGRHHLRPQQPTA